MDQFNIIDASCNLVFPWYTHPFLKVLRTWDIKDRRVFEYGGGLSTLWWAHNAKEVIAVDAHQEWVQRVRTGMKPYPNAKIIHREVTPNENELNSPYVQEINLHGGEFDIICIDGSYRDECVQMALSKIKTGGIIICDNWDQDYVWDSILAGVLLKDYKGELFTQPDHKDHSGRPWKTGYWVIDRKPSIDLSKQIRL